MLMANPKYYPLFTSKKIYLCFSIVVFLYIIYVNLNNQAGTTKQSPSWENVSVPHPKFRHTSPRFFFPSPPKKKKNTQEKITLKPTFLYID
jgi:hypothetical protein